MVPQCWGFFLGDKMKKWGVYSWIEIITQDNRNLSADEIFTLVMAKLNFYELQIGPYNKIFWSKEKIKQEIFQIKNFHPGKHIIKKAERSGKVFKNYVEMFDHLLLELDKINSRKGRQEFPLSRLFISEALGCSEDTAWKLRKKFEESGKLKLIEEGKTKFVKEQNNYKRFGKKIANLYSYVKEAVVKAIEEVKTQIDFAIERVQVWADTKWMLITGRAARQFLAMRGLTQEEYNERYGAC